MEEDALDPIGATLVQSIFAAAGVVSELVLQRIHQSSCRVAGAEEEFDVRILRTERDLLKPLDLELKKCRSEENGEFIYVLVSLDEQLNGNADFAALDQTGYAFYHALDAVFANDRCEGATESEIRQISNASKQNANAIDYLFANKWIERDRGRVFATVRTLYNHKAYITNTYGRTGTFKIHECLGCKEFLLKGTLCTNLSCPARLHEHCYDSYFKKKRLEPGKCPLCEDGRIIKGN